MRAVLDSLGQTGSTDDANAHNNIVRSARRWFRLGIEAQYVFDLARIDFKPVRDSILRTNVKYRQTRRKKNDR